MAISLVLCYFSRKNLWGLWHGALSCWKMTSLSSIKSIDGMWSFPKFLGMHQHWVFLWNAWFLISLHHSSYKPKFLCFRNPALFSQQCNRDGTTHRLFCEALYHFYNNSEGLFGPIFKLIAKLKTSFFCLLVSLGFMHAGRHM